MDPIAVARVLKPYCPDASTAAVLLAIAWGESGLNPQAQGDRLGNPINCQGYESFGLWQIHMASHWSWLVPLVGSSSPCVVANWLLDPDHNAQAAVTVFLRQGFGAWTQYKNGGYLRYLAQAEAAVAVVYAPVAVGFSLAGLLLVTAFLVWKGVHSQ